MTGTMALVGGDEFRQNCREMDTEIMAAAGFRPAAGTAPAPVVAAGR